MKKKMNILMLLFVVLLILVLICILHVDKKEKSSYLYGEGGVKYALFVDGNPTINFPSKGAYRVEVICTNATCKWLYNEWKLAVENVIGDVSCDINFVTIEKTYLNNYVMSLVSKTQGNGQVVLENGYRYEGKDPNNYVLFNDELWRIIGVFDSATHGITNQNLIKLVRSDSLGSFAWSKSDVNNWVSSSLNSLLNNSYLNAQDGTSSGNCYNYSTTISTVCDFTRNGIRSGYREMIKNVTWHLGGNQVVSLSADSYYSYERGTTVYSGRPTSTTGYIGLMYPSDYGYSVLSSSCARSTYLEAYNTEVCAGQSWLYGFEGEWLIFPFSDYTTYVYIINAGNVNYVDSYFGHNVRPTLYLDSSVYVIDGDGSITNPYIIGM